MHVGVGWCVLNYGQRGVIKARVNLLLLQLTSKDTETEEERAGSLSDVFD